MLRHSRLFALLLVAVACVALPAPAALARGGDRSTPRQARAAYPEAPSGRYSPRLVQQLYNNCAFASAEMLIDKWTEGRRRAPQQTLRRLTGIAPVEGGPTLSQLRRAVARTSGIDMRWSPHGGDALTWHDLLARLEAGGGAIVNVWPAKLPGHYRRWLPALVAGHSVYVERYEHSKNRVWLMDPLGRGRGFRGEWINADQLHAAMWHTGQFVWAAATPPPAPRPPTLADFTLGTPEVAAAAFSEDSITVAMTYAPSRFGATLPELRMAGEWERVPDAPPAEDGDAAADPQAAAPPEAAAGPEAALGPEAAAEANAAAERYAAADPQGEIAPPSVVNAVPSADPSMLPDVAPRVPTGLEPIDAFATSSSDVPDVMVTLPPVVDTTPVPFVALSETLTADDGSLLTKLATPHVPGDYVLELALRDAKGQAIRGDVPRFAPITVRVRGPLVGSLKVRGAHSHAVRQGDAMSIAVKTSNLGRVAWDETRHAVAMAVSWDGAASTPLLPVEVAAGATTVVQVVLLVDAEVGRRTLRFTLVDGTGAPLPDSAPLELVLDVSPRDTRVAERH